MNKYYLTTSSLYSTSFYIFSVDQHDCVSSTTVTSETLKSPFLLSITSREPNFHNRQFSGSMDSFYGWSLSKAEYDRLKRLVELEESYREFNRLSADI